MSGGVRPVDSDCTRTRTSTTGATHFTRAERTSEVSEDTTWQSREGWVERGTGAGTISAPTGEGGARAPIGRMGAPVASTATADDVRGADYSSSRGSPGIGARGVSASRKDDPSAAPPTRSLPDIRYDSSDAGNFYCEHAYYVAQQQALASSGTVLSNSSGERLVGFIHLPEDAQTTRAPNPLATDSEVAARHGDTRRVVGAAIAGYYNDAASRTTEPVRIMLTGFGPFDTVTDNPSGDFVAHRANIDAAMEQAFGSRLVGRPPPGADMNQPLVYRVRQDDGSTREVHIRALQLPVSDAALDPAQRGSIPAEMASFRPHAVISMGVRPGSSHYDVEGRADDARLARGTDGTFRRDTTRDRTSEGERNGSLRRAIEWARTHPVP